MDELKKEISQPTKLKTSGSTFKNPKDQTSKSMGINQRVCYFRDAEISKKD